MQISSTKNFIYICCLAICLSFSIGFIALSSEEKNKIEILLDQLAHSENPSSAGLIRRKIWSLWLEGYIDKANKAKICLLYTSPSPRDMRRSRMPSSA